MIRTELENLKAALAALKHGFLVVIFYSFLVNLLMLASPLYMLQVYDRVLTSRSIDTLLLLTLIMIAALLTLAVLEGVRTALMVRLGHWLEKHLAGNLLTATIVHSLKSKVDFNVQGLRDLTTFRSFLTGPSIFPILDAPWTPIYLALIFMLHPVLGWVGLVGAIILFLLGLVNELLTRNLLQQSGAVSIQAFNQASAAARNADVIEAMGLLPNLLSRWNKSNNDSLLLQAAASQRSGILSAASKFVRLSLQMAMLGGGALFVLSGEMTGGGIIAASILVGRALSPVEQAINSWRSAVSARDSYQRISKQLAETPLRGQAMPLPVPQGKVTAENLSFAFKQMRKPLLKSISFNLKPGEMLGLVGPSGSGKTTLVRLLLGNLVPASGHARLDGMDVSQWESEDRGQYLGYLPQDVELFGGTIRENISRMAEGEPESVYEAARLAGVHELILRMPQGYDTVIGEGGMTLSGGERQRIALARALYADPKFIVLDEPNASLDREGELALLQCLKKVKQKAITVIVIAHRPAVLECVDKMMVLQEGVVKAFGPRNEVLQSIAQSSTDKMTRLS